MTASKPGQMTPESAISRIDSVVTSMVPTEVADDRIDPGAQLSILRLAWSPNPGDRGKGVYLLSAVKAEVLGGIVASDSPVVTAVSVERALDEVGAAVLATDDLPLVVFDRRLRFNVPGMDDALRSVVRTAFEELDRSTAQFAARGLSQDNPWSCAAVCALCAALILDPVLGNEAFACAACIAHCTSGTALAPNGPIGEPVFLKA